MKKVSYHLINNTNYNLSLEQALKYINYITNKQFTYHNDNNYDGLNYEKIIYIETTFAENEEIQLKIKNLKNYIAQNYLFKQKYLQRIKSNVFTTDINLNDILTFKEHIFFGLPVEEK